MDVVLDTFQKYWSTTHCPEEFYDGDWEKDDKKAVGETVARLDLIASLSNSSNTDLGPDDADFLAELALQNSNIQIQSKATEVIVDRFPTGSNIAIAIVCQWFSSSKLSKKS